jgi:hypothetical protein
MMDVRKMASMGQKEMRKQQSPAEKVFWPLQAGRPRELKPSLLEAVLLGRQTANKLYSGMRDAKLSMKDGVCVLVFAKDGKLAGNASFAYENEEAGDLEIVQKCIIRAKWEPIGIAFMLADREKSKLMIHTRAFESTEQNERILTAVQDTWKMDVLAGKMGAIRSN